MKNNSFKIFMTIIITAIVTFSVTMLWQYGNNKPKVSENVIGSAIQSDAVSTKLKLIRDKIDKDYIGEVNETNLEEYAIKGYVAGLDDEYSEYLTSEEMSDFTDDTLGNYVGIGVYMSKDEEKNTIVIYSVIKNSPAEQAGLKSGDIIKAVDGVEYTADDFEEIAKNIKGKEGTKVKLNIVRNDEALDFEIERKRVEIIRVAGMMLEDNIGYICISSFDGSVAEQLKTEYTILKEQGATSLIIDVRNNGGGLVTEAVKIGDMLTDKGKTLLIQADNKSNEETTTSKNDKEINMNVVLLTNKYSASASEILAAIIKEDLDNGKIVGTKTYGKGVIQTLYPLSDGSGLKLTPNKFVTPNHNEIHKVGIEPDYNVEYEYTGTLDTEKDLQLKKAIEVLKNW